VNPVESYDAFLMAPVKSTIISVDEGEETGFEGEETGLIRIFKP
jgi:hypothetical protein